VKGGGGSLFLGMYPPWGTLGFRLGSYEEGEFIRRGCDRKWDSKGGQGEAIRMKNGIVHIIHPQWGKGEVGVNQW